MAEQQGPPRFRHFVSRVIRRLAPRFYNRRAERLAHYTVHQVHPADIRYVVPSTFCQGRVFPEIAAGDWDALDREIEATPHFQALRHVLQCNGEWDETEWYRQVARRIRQGQRLWNCTDDAQFHARLDRLEIIYNEVAEHGYVPSRGLHEICIDVGRHGDLLLHDGAHRLAIAKLLNVEAVPVRIIVRHLEWVRFKNRILDFARTHDGQIYAPIAHPDLEQIPAVHGDKRFELIRWNTSLTTGTVLDIGCNWGYFCHRLQRIGFDCVGVEVNEFVYDILSRIRRATGGAYKIVQQSIFDAFGAGPIQFDMVLALAIFHHFIKTKELHGRLREFLSRVECQEMYFIPHLQSESQMADAYWNPTEQEFVDWLIDSCPSLRTARLLGPISNGRSMYLLSS